MRTSQLLVPSLGALLLAALIALAGCGAPPPNPGSDRGEVGPTPDAVVADGPNPDDRPVVVIDGGDSDVVDASTPDVTPPEDRTPPVDSGPVMCDPRTLSVRGEPCVRAFPPGMTRGDFAIANRVCPPAPVTVRISGKASTTLLDCRIGADGLTYLDVSHFFTGGGWMSCVDMTTFEYYGPTRETRGIQWDASHYEGRTVIWPPGVTPGTGTSTPMPGGITIAYD